MRTHKTKIDALNANLKSHEVRAQKCLRSKQRSETIKKERRAEADERQAVRDALSPKEQLQVLDRRLGVGVGAVKERARLNKLISSKGKK